MVPSLRNSSWGQLPKERAIPSSGGLRAHGERRCGGLEFSSRHRIRRSVLVHLAPSPKVRDAKKVDDHGSQITKAARNSQCREDPAVTSVAQWK